MKMLKELANTVIKDLSFHVGDENIFLGGSLRFGYSNQDSDIDIFIYVPEGVDYQDFIQYLSFNGFSIVLNKYKYEQNWVQMGLKGLVHLNITRYKKAFFKLKDEHIMVEWTFKEHPVLFTVVDTLKIHDLSGAKIFRMLRQMAYKIEKSEIES